MSRWHSTLVSFGVMLSLPVPLFALGKEKAMYVGGTLALREKTEGRMETTNADSMVFRTEKGGGSVEIPWANVASIEYGQRASRRWVTGVLLSPVALFAKSRKHFITVSYKDAAGMDQAAVFELGKEAFRPTLASLKARSGKDVLCQDDEARKQMGGTCALAPATDNPSEKK